MERNPIFSKERADFVFNRIQKYFDQHGYSLVLKEIEENRELLGSSLNIGSQLKLNKIHSTTVVSLLLDAFEVDGDILTFSTLFARHKTMLEIHTDRETYQLLNNFQTQREGHPNYKSREVSLNKMIEPDPEEYLDESVVQISIKNTNEKNPSAKDIERDFLESIESPSFQHGYLSEEEEAMPADNVIRSNVNKKAIHDDFFEAIRAPKLSELRTEPDNFEQLSFEATGVSSKPHETDPDRPRKQSTGDTRTNSVIEPIVIEQSILAKEDDSLQAIREKLQRIEERTSGKKPASKESKKPKRIDAVKEEREIVQDGQVRKETVHKSGGKITEITIDGYSLDSGAQPLEPQKSAAQKNKKSQKSKQNRQDKSSQENHANREIDPINEQSSSSKGNRDLFVDNRKSVVSDRKSEANLNVLVIALALLCAVLLAFGVFKGVRWYLNRGNTPNTTITEPSTDEQTTTDEGSENTDNQSTENTNGTDTASNDSAANNTTATADAADYLLPSSERELIKADYENLTKSQTRIAINELFARHGWNFGGSGEMYDYFIQKTWYKPDLAMTSAAQAETKFSAIERKNLATLTAFFQTFS